MKGKRHWLADWRSVRVWEAEQRHVLRRRHALWLHGWIIGAFVLALMWGVAHAQMLLGLDSLAVRYLVMLGVGYLAFLCTLRVWAGWLVKEEGDLSGAGDVLDVAADGAEVAFDVARSIDLPLGRGSPQLSGRGGDFGGGGAQGDFGAPADGSVVGDLASGALEVAGGADEGAVVVVPVVAVFLAGCLVLLGAGSLLLLYFGSEALLAVAVEVAFSYVSARTAIRVVRAGWVDQVVGLTWKPLAGALLCAFLLGLALDTLVPEARSLPHAIQLMRQQP